MNTDTRVAPEAVAMSLKAVHIVFIATCVVLGVGLAWWGYDDYRQTGETFSVVACVSGVSLVLAAIPYAVWFVRKLKKVSYL